MTWDTEKDGDYPIRYNLMVRSNRVYRRNQSQYAQVFFRVTKLWGASFRPAPDASDTAEFMGARGMDTDTALAPNGHATATTAAGGPQFVKRNRNGEAPRRS